MTDAAARAGKRTIEDWRAQPEESRLELIDDALVERASPVYEHGVAQAGLVSALWPTFHRRGGKGGPGGWWIASEVAVQLGANVFLPDLVGWRRERVPVLITLGSVAMASASSWTCASLAMKARPLGAT